MQFNCCNLIIQVQNATHMNQVDTDLTQTVEGQAIADTSNIQSENQAGTEVSAGSGEVERQSEDVAIATEAPAPTPTDEVNDIGDINEYEAMKARLSSDPDALATPAPPEEVPQKEEESPIVDATEEVAKEETQEEAESPSPEGDSAEKRASQFRLRPEEKLDAEAFRIFKAAQSAQAPVSMSDAITLAKNHLGLTEPTAQPTQSAEESQGEEAGELEDDVFEGITQAAAKQHLTDLRKEQIEAMRNGDLDEAADLGDQMIEAEELVEVLGYKEAEAVESAEAQMSAEFEDSLADATELYPEFSKEGTAFFAKCREIDDALQITDDPRYYEGNKPMLVAQMAARELNVIPVVAGSAPVATQAPSITPPQQSISPQPARTEKPVPLPAASGSSRTSGGNSGTAKDLQQKIAEITNPEQFAAMARAMGQT
jgi:hypothetical protein